MTVTGWPWVLAGFVSAMQGQGRLPLRLDVDRHASRVVQQHDKNLLRFGTSVEVVGQPPQAVLEQRFRDLNLTCGPVTGPPSHYDMRQFIPGNAPYADFTSLAAALLAKTLQAKKQGPGRYVLYRVVQQGRVTYTVRDGPLPATWHHNMPGTTFEELATFADLKAATAALRRMEQGFDKPTRSKPGDPPPPWATSPCEPGK